MRYLSVCSGIEAATVAWHPLGWEPFAFSEIEKFPSAVLAHHWPDVPNLGDMQNHEQWPEANIDLLVGGTPCQSFSVAGLRAGLADPRGNLALTFLAVAERYRPTWIVWENVPGVLSSNGGRDFGSFLGALVKLRYGFAYRILDAQYFGVPQRRRRVFVVGYLGDWRRAAEVLFEPESLRRDPPPSRETGETAPTIPARSTAGGGLGTDFDCDGGLQVSHSLRGEGFDASEDGTGRGTPLVPEVGLKVSHDPAMTLTHREHKGALPEADLSTVVFHPTQTPIHSEDGLCHALGTGSRQGQATAAVAFTASEQANSYAWERPVYPTLDAQVPNDSSNIQKGIRSGMAVRRLTPLECERLQGFPDRYTDIPKASDSARYKALGNSMAVPVMAWIGTRIQRILTTGGAE